ncbi:MAG: hypothetical protein ACE5DL_03755 [Nitrosopumilaceae archaeon]
MKVFFFLIITSIFFIVPFELSFGEEIIPIKTPKDFFKIREPLEIIYQNNGEKQIVFRAIMGHLTIISLETGNIVKGPLASGFLEPLILKPGQSEPMKIPLNKKIVPGIYSITVKYEIEKASLPMEMRPTYEIFITIGCSEGLEFIQKRNNDSACVKPESIPKLVERGWAK